MERDLAFIRQLQSYIVFIKSSHIVVYKVQIPFRLIRQGRLGFMKRK